MTYRCAVSGSTRASGPPAAAGRGVAVREFILDKPHGRVDYLLFVDGKPAGVIEAKPEGMTLTEVEHQSGASTSPGCPRT